MSTDFDKTKVVLTWPRDGKNVGDTVEVFEHEARELVHGGLARRTGKQPDVAVPGADPQPRGKRRSSAQVKADKAEADRLKAEADAAAAAGTPETAA